MTFRKLATFSMLLLSIAAVSACLDTVNAENEALLTQVPRENIRRPSTAPSAGSSTFFFISVPSTSNRDRYLSVNASTSFNNGPHAGKPASVTITVRNSGKIDRGDLRIGAADPQMAQRIADDNHAGLLDESLIFSFGRQLAAQSVCPSQRITANTYGRSLSNPAAISDLLAANGGRVLGSQLPSGAGPIAAVRQLNNSWRVSLWCH